MKKTTNESGKYCLGLATCYSLGENKNNKHLCCHACRGFEKCKYACIENPEKCKLNTTNPDISGLDGMLNKFKENKKEKKDGKQQPKGSDRK